MAKSKFSQKNPSRNKAKAERKRQEKRIKKAKQEAEEKMLVNRLKRIADKPKPKETK
jgi:hypothetical protein